MTSFNTSHLVNAENSMLVVIDVQTRLLSAMSEENAQWLPHNVKKLLHASQLLNVPYLITEQYPKGLGATVAGLDEYIQPELVIEKTCFSCTDSAAFMQALTKSGRRQVILTGMEAHICVLQSALLLQTQGFHVSVVSDAVCSRQQYNKDNALVRLSQAGVSITNLESVVFEWLADAHHSQFKAVSKLVV